jgi:hypothetical protein
LPKTVCLPRPGRRQLGAHDHLGEKIEIDRELPDIFLRHIGKEKGIGVGQQRSDFEPRCGGNRKMNSWQSLLIAAASAIRVMPKAIGANFRETGASVHLT